MTPAAHEFTDAQIQAMFENADHARHTATHGGGIDADLAERYLATASPECLEYDPAVCDGAVEYRLPLSGTGRAFARCDAHWENRLDIQEGIQSRYGGDCAPADFDPSYCGERWDEDY